ncbi:MAG: RNA methyltransferase [Hyphomicrobiales bacterium]|nr:RNA methyltransferase [Hyphomicrobiales bacterium]
MMPQPPSPLLAPVIVLHRPQLGENIGAAARAMANFGLSELRLAEARPGWDETRALAAARAAAPVLKQRRDYDTLAASVADLHYVVASTARRRDMVKPALSPPAMAAAFRREQMADRRCGILFGPERAGLDNEALTLADALVHIACAPGQASLNLAQAVLLLSHACYRAPPVPDASEASAHPLAPTPKAEWSNFGDHLEAALHAAGYLTPPEKAPVMLRALKNFLARARPSEQELRSLRGALNALLLWPHKGKRTPSARAAREKIKKLAGGGSSAPEN